MATVKCRECEKMIFHKYQDVLNRPTNKYINKIVQDANEDINTSIYLTCDNNHFNKYYTKILTNE